MLMTVLLHCSLPDKALQPHLAEENFTQNQLLLDVQLSPATTEYGQVCDRLS